MLRNKLNNIISHNEIESDDIVVCIVHFNPSGYIRPIMNNLYLFNYLERNKIPHYIIELVYPNKNNILPKKDNVIHVESNSYMFHKENLFNVLVSKLPNRYKKIICLDGDVLIDSENWINEVSKKLDEFDIVMPYNVSYQVSMDFNKHDFGGVCMIDRKSNCEEGFYNSGYGICFNRTFFEEIGLFEYAILGGGDRMTLCELVGRKIMVNEFNSNKKNEYIEKIKSKKFKYGFLNNDIYHLYHGNGINRKYLDRHFLLSNLNIDYELTKNKYGILEFIEPNKYNDIILEYFNNRKEDN